MPYKKETLWSVYLVECQDNSLYCGVTTDMKRRLWEHNNSAKGAKYTRARRPVLLLDSIAGLSQSTALKTEAFIKACPKSLKLKAMKILKEMREVYSIPS